MTKDELKTPAELADREVNKKLATMIAERKLKIMDYKSQIKKLEKEIQKIIDGEISPSSSSLR